ncbi:kinetochore protein Nuf2 [Corythoichthys intestinalis]|uniref:kinetochore protein Nuf2 n=1 Tax=Corythoichthys intestinalis TaxID=161448 RepID=UPI0025A5FE5F|nr:kinetochore protein Nuf2 [Corythoichthys intestinalis]XP_061791954.1 kinetochore protein Nuf2-like [Nerophis lumbriciformis]
MTENAFPVHPVDVIVNFYRTEVLTGEEAKHFARSDLTPSAKTETVQMLYMSVMHQLFRFRPECRSMVPLLENIQHPECHEKSTAILSVYACMRKFLPVCLVYDFSLNDLLAPKKPRTLTILSAIMNYLQFRKLRMAAISEKEAKLRLVLEKQQTYAKQIQEAEEKIEILTTIPPEQQAEASKLEAALSELQAKTTDIYKEVKAKNDIISEGKSIIAEKTQKLAQFKIDIDNVKEHIMKLKSQIVESPEDLKIQMERMREDVKNLKISIGQTDDYVVELQNMVQRLSHIEMEIQQMTNLLQHLETSMTAAKQQDEENQQLIAQSEQKQNELKNLIKEEEQLRRTLTMKQDREAKHNLRRQKKKEQKEERVQDALRDCDKLHQKHEEKAEKIQQILRENQQLKVKIQNIVDDCRKSTEAAQVMYDALSAAMDEMDRGIVMRMTTLKEDALKRMQK